MPIATPATHPEPIAWIDGIACLAPGLADWTSTRAVLRGEQSYIPAATVLPPPLLLPAAERRRASRIVKLALALGDQASADTDPTTLATVFTSSSADGHNCHALCEQLAGDDRQISPTRFHNSVHNAAAGYWSIAARSMEPCQVICAHDASFGAGLIDAMAQIAVDRHPVLLIAYDAEYPEPLYGKRPIPDAGGIALLLGPRRNKRSLAAIRLTMTADPPTGLAEPALEALRLAIPALRGLPLLRQLACRENGRTVIDYLPPQQLALEVTPC